MDRGAKRYNWAAYYAAAYEKERKKNIVLAEHIADAERRQADLSDNLNRICATPFWKITVPFRRMHCNMKERLQQHRDKDRCSEKNACLLRYAKEVRRQKQPYQEWLKENDNECNGNAGYSAEQHRDDMPVSDWQTMRIPESDIVLLTYGGGMLDADAFEKIKSYFNENETCMTAYTDEDFYWEDLTQRMHPWFKPCYSPDTLLSFNYWGHLVAVKEEVLNEALKEDGIRNRNMENEEHSVRFYDLCLRLEEAVHRQGLLQGGAVSRRICHIPGVFFHRLYVPGDKAREKIIACGTREEQFIKAEQCLQQELEEGLHLTGAGAEYVAVREAALHRRGCRGRLLCGPEPDIYHVVYDTSISGRERCARAQRADRHIYPHPLVSVVIPSKDHPDVLEQCLESFRKKTSYDCYEWKIGRAHV